MRCIECGALLERTIEPMETEFRGTNLVIEGIEHFKCPTCGETVLDSKMNNEYDHAVDREYRKACGLLSPEEIKQFRNGWDLTQEQLQALLGVGKLSVCRWETGRLAQSKTVDNLLRAYMSCPHLVTQAMTRLGIEAPAGEFAPAGIDIGGTKTCAARTQFSSRAARPELSLQARGLATRRSSTSNRTNIPNSRDGLSSTMASPRKLMEVAA